MLCFPFLWFMLCSLLFCSVKSCEMSYFVVVFCTSPTFVCGAIVGFKWPKKLSTGPIFAPCECFDCLGVLHGYWIRISPKTGILFVTPCINQIRINMKPADNPKCGPFFKKLRKKYIKKVTFMITVSKYTNRNKKRHKNLSVLQRTKI